MVDLPTYQQEAVLIPWVNHSALAIWVDRRSSNPGRCCGAGAVGDIFDNIYAQVLSEVSLVADEERTAVRRYELFSAYPNPFNPVTQISYVLAQSGHVRLSVVNLLGQEVAVLADERQEAGEYSVSWNASELSSGLYFARLETQGNIMTRKLVLLR